MYSGNFAARGYIRNAGHEFARHVDRARGPPNCERSHAVTSSLGELGDSSMLICWPPLLTRRTSTRAGTLQRAIGAATHGWRTSVRAKTRVELRRLTRRRVLFEGLIAFETHRDKNGERSRNGNTDIRPLRKHYGVDFAHGCLHGLRGDINNSESCYALHLRPIAGQSLCESVSTG